MTTKPRKTKRKPTWTDLKALVCMFEQALKSVSQLEPDQQPPFVERLESVRHEGHDWGYGVGEDMDNLMAEYGFGEE